jgi:hypothetical protein
MDDPEDKLVADSGDVDMPVSARSLDLVETEKWSEAV